MQVIHKMHVVTMVKVKMSFSVSRLSATVQKQVNSTSTVPPV